MLLSKHNDLKAEIKALPEKEKDKLLLRLIAKDKLLTEHLHFKLLEGPPELAERQQHLEERINEGEETLLAYGKRLNSKETLQMMRKLNTSITHHYKVTRDTNSEMELRVHLFKMIPLDFPSEVISLVPYKFNEKLMLYFAKSVFSAYNKYLKMHEDIRFDLKEHFDEVLDKVYSHRTAPIAKKLGLPRES